MIGLLAWIQKMPWFLIPLSILAAIGCVLFIVNQWRQRKEKGNISKLSDKKIELLIRDWLDLPGFSVERVPAKLPIKFNFLFIDKHKRSINIVRDTVLPEIIQLLARFVISSNDAPLNESVVNKIAGNIKLEIARLGVEYGFDGTPNPHNSVHFLVPVILDDSLNFNNRNFNTNKRIYREISAAYFNKSTKSIISHARSVTLASIAGVTLRV
jgi:hypothetical protein